MLEINHSSQVSVNGLLVFSSGALIGVSTGKSINWYKKSWEQPAKFINFTIVLALLVLLLGLKVAGESLFSYPLYLVSLQAIIVVFLFTLTPFLWNKLVFSLKTAKKTSI